MAFVYITANENSEHYMINKKYCEAITNFGAIPILVTANKSGFINQIVNHADGILLSGGGDIHAKFFNQQLDETACDINTERDLFEIELCRAAIKNFKPILGICRGMQILNVALGGDIIQNIDGHIQSCPRDKTFHSVSIKNNTSLKKIVGVNSLKVNSIHHQAVGNLGNGLTISATSNDGTIEAIEFEKANFVIGVQWHPETLFQKSESHANIFKKFVANVCNFKRRVVNL